MKDSNVYKLYVKGADSSIMPYLTSHTDHPYLEKAQRALDDFSSVGLRTLVFGCRFFTETQFRKIEAQYNDAVTSENKKEKMKALAYKVETDLVLLGCTAIRDHLQDKVPESIIRFLQAKIKVWMITGDKLQTAESIAYSAGIFQPDMEVFSLDACNKATFHKAVFKLRKKMQLAVNVKKRGIIIDISMNNFIFTKKNTIHGSELLRAITILESMLMDVDAVVCARSSPKQKAKLVRMVKNNNKVVLAVGDGANDVNMLTVDLYLLRKPILEWEFTVKRASRLFKSVITRLVTLSFFGSLYWFKVDGTTSG